MVKSNTLRQIAAFLRTEMKLPEEGVENGLAIQEIEQVIDQILDGGPPVELSPQDSTLRRLQHQLIENYGLTSTSTGREPNRRVVIFAS